jgi:hypothetical protein
VHVHISPPELYDLCDRAGMLIWQDFELNWVHDPSAEFEARALRLQQDTIALLFNHPSMLTWTCHKSRRWFRPPGQLRAAPDPALYAAALAQTTPADLHLFRADGGGLAARGDIHTYYGAIWSATTGRLSPYHADEYRIRL